jgi:hypothetical protein
MARFIMTIVAVIMSIIPGSLARAAPATPRCPARALVLRPGPALSMMTGEHAIMYKLTNQGAGSCAVTGYPRVVLYAASGKALPFRYAHGGGPYVTARKPDQVVLAPGASAYVLVAKYRCDLGIVATVTAVRVTMPVPDGATFTRHAAIGRPILSYCRGGPRDPGQTVTVSPIEPTAQATSSL